ncbi:hypothetical protein O181_088369 [Austropuccinia psidii MF-1]|uniref:Uncharacterized protein n=1 Tax=Austropuccinia psidii MF-1 TaxID=1389203 RepID=A0A9Q3IRH9_9BASI|nr:hypothetical protein [Austropuccinia psidii MF-1]
MSAPQAIPLKLVLGVFSSFQGPMAPSTNSRPSGSHPLIRGLWAIWAPYGFYCLWTVGHILQSTVFKPPRPLFDQLQWAIPLAFQPLRAKMTQNLKNGNLFHGLWQPP